MLYVARGFAKLITNGETFTKLDGKPNLGNTGFIETFAAKPLGIPLPIWVMIAFAIAFSIILNRTAFGRWLYASGGNPRAAALTGVPVDCPRLSGFRFILALLLLLLLQQLT